MKKYIVESGEDRSDTHSLRIAKLIAGEWQLDRDRIVYIERRTLPRRRWRATLKPSGEVVLIDAHLDPATGGKPRKAKPWELQPPADVARPDSPKAERARRVAIYAGQWDAIESKLGRIVDGRRGVRRRFEAGELKGSGRRRVQPMGLGAHAPAKTVIELATGKSFASVALAAQAAGVSRQSMQRRIKHGKGWAIANSLPVGGANVVVA